MEHKDRTYPLVPYKEETGSLARLWKAGAAAASVANSVAQKTFILVPGGMLMPTIDAGAVGNRMIGQPDTTMITASVDGKQCTREELEEAAAAAELATLTLTSEMLERAASKHQPPAEWYHRQEDKPF